MKSNLPIELTMAVACVAVFFAVPPTTDPDGTVVSPLGSPLIAIVNYRRVLEKEKREAAFKSSSVESAAEILEKDSEQLLKVGRYFVILDFPERTTPHEKKIVRDFYEGEIAKSNLNPANRDKAASEIDSFVHDLTPVQSGESYGYSITREGIRSISIPAQVVEWITGFSDEDAARAALEKFWRDAQKSFGDSHISASSSLPGIAVVGFLWKRELEGETNEVLVLSTEAPSANPGRNGGVWPAHVRNGAAWRRFVTIARSFQSKSLKFEQHAAFRPIRVLEGDGESYPGAYAEVENLEFVQVRGRWRLLVESDALQELIFIKKGGRPFPLIVPENKVEKFKELLSELRDLSGLISNSAYFETFSSFGKEYLVVKDAFYEDASRAIMLKNESEATAKTLGSKRHTELSVISSIQKEGYGHPYVYLEKKPVFGLVGSRGFGPDRYLDAANAMNEIREEGRGFRVEPYNYFNPDKITIVMGDERTVPVARVSWERKNPSGEGGNRGGCNIVFIDDRWIVVLPANVFFDSKGDLQ